MRIKRFPSTAVVPFVLLVMLGTGTRMVRSADPPGEKVLFEENFTDMAQ